MSSQPKAPDPYAQAAAQGRAENTAAQNSAIINNPNVYSPYGSQTYSLAGYEKTVDAQGNPTYVPRYNQTIKLSPDQERLLGLQTMTQGNLGKTAVQQSAKIGNLLNTTLDTKGLEAWNRGQAPGEIRQDQSATDRPAIEQAMLARYRDQSAKQNAAQDAQLAARGLNPGSAQYGQVADTRARSDVDAMNQAYLASGQESRAAQAAYNQAEQQRYQEGQDYASFLNNLRGSQLQERTALRQEPINEITALLSGSQVTVPQFQPFSRQGINAAPVGSYIGQNYANQLQASNQFNQGLFGLGGSLLGGIGQAGGFGAFF